MNIIILPASGQNFICQLAILQHLCEINYEPSLLLGSSGGNLAAYIACAANWQSNHIERISKELKSYFFAQPWHDIKIISGSIGFFNGNAFRSGEGLNTFMKTYFTNETITKYEIWTGTYNRDLQKFRLFCNKSKELSSINCNTIDFNLTQSMEPYFCDGNIDKIAQAGLASAAIPGMIPSVIIDDHHYTDGATCGASPISIMREAILKCEYKEFHITYINSKDLSQAKIIPNHNLFDTWKQAVNDLIKSQTLIDRLTTHDLLFNGKNVNHSSFKCNHENLIDITNKRKTLKYSLLEIYPTQESDIDITNFNSDDIVRNLHIMYECCECHFWWMD